MIGRDIPFERPILSISLSSVFVFEVSEVKFEVNAAFALTFSFKVVASFVVNFDELGILVLVFGDDGDGDDDEVGEEGAGLSIVNSSCESLDNLARRNVPESSPLTRIVTLTLSLYFYLFLLS